MQLTIDRYQVRRLIGQGAMGKIYLAGDPKLGRDVAIKLLSSRNANRELRDRFRLEARAVAALKHPNIVELYDYSGEQADELFLVMEYVPGRTLHEHVIERGPMPEVTALCIAHELALALEYAHRNNVVHRDLKPENVMLHEGRVVLTDFGVVKQVASEGALGKVQERSVTQALGTPGFMSPEQLIGRDITAATDIFALGALLYNLVTGRLPFDGVNIAEVAEKVRKGTFEDPRSFSPTLSPGFCDLVATCLQPRPRDRPASAVAVREVVLDVLRAHGVTEVRQEIVDYEHNPATHAVAQRERALEVLSRDLELAIQNRDEAGARAIVRRMQQIAPLTDRARRVPGLRWRRGSEVPSLAPSHAPSRLGWLLAGGVVGAVVGGGASLTLLAMGIIPTWVMVWFERIADAVARN